MTMVVSSIHSLGISNFLNILFLVYTFRFIWPDAVTSCYFQCTASSSPHLVFKSFFLSPNIFPTCIIHHTFHSPEVRERESCKYSF